MGPGIDGMSGGEGRQGLIPTTTKLALSKGTPRVFSSLTRMWSPM
jgi:hypothetical protein